jgi:hypothetical protein
MSIGVGAIALQGCLGAPRVRAAERQVEGAGAKRLVALGPERERILALASRAASSHNTQPWVVRVVEPDRWLVGADRDRRLPVVDPLDRELALSVGGFLENLAVAASAYGFEALFTPLGEERASPELVEVRLATAPAEPSAPERIARIERRRTLRKHYLDRPLSPEALAVLTAALGPRARWFPRGSHEAGRLAVAAAEAFKQQTWRDAAQSELARWIRFGDADARAKADGLTADTMEVGGLAGFFVRHFMDARSVTGKRFRDAGVDGTYEQARQGAGWLVLDAPDERVSSILDAGRRFARMGLLLRERRLAAHPMSQLLEEEPWRGSIGRELGLDGLPQFVLRVGYVEDYPEPVSLRRQVSAFTVGSG